LKKARIAQGSPVADLETHRPIRGESTVKANLARFTLALAIIASMALTLGAGIRWG
jgi:hypothetical protein